MAKKRERERENGLATWITGVRGEREVFFEQVFLKNAFLRDDRASRKPLISECSGGKSLEERLLRTSLQDESFCGSACSRSRLSAVLHISINSIALPVELLSYKRP